MQLVHGIVSQVLGFSENQEAKARGGNQGAISEEKKEEVFIESLLFDDYVKSWKMRSSRSGVEVCELGIKFGCWQQGHNCSSKFLHIKEQESV